MPEVKPNESSRSYISRCVKQVMSEGKTRDQALGKCYGMLRQKRGNKGLMPKRK
jgi:hypothetical protein